MTTHKLKFETIEERLEWTKMREALDRHSCYTNKNKYYPYNMDVWEQERKVIENGYRDKIYESNLNRLKKCHVKPEVHVKSNCGVNSKTEGNFNKKIHMRRSSRISHMPEVHYYHAE
tara:strand:+ start:38 stop:388 length:351 start_codon:yes stop_codon:yes gene_type:complete